MLKQIIDGWRSQQTERQLYDQYKQKGFVRAKQRMSDDLWTRHVYAKDEERLSGLQSRLTEAQTEYEAMTATLGEPWEQVLAAAEASIRSAGAVSFSLRQLASDAGVAFKTPFNLFGSNAPR